ncbi:MAG: MTH938/NDUFAF3 family protein [bacterium]|nr:MTH938/NDUFAF3 family protein [bacterium]
MQINDYQFGLITIDEKRHANDVEIRNFENEVLAWWRKESHCIDCEDVKKAVSQKPELIIIGTGYSGMAQITENAKKEIESGGIKLIIEKTGDAVKTFNAEGDMKGKKIIGLFHLTC